MSLGSTQLLHGWIDSNLHLMGFVSMGGPAAKVEFLIFWFLEFRA